MNTTTRGFVIEQDAVTRKQVVMISVADCHPVSIGLRRPIRITGTKRRLFALRRLLGTAKDFATSRLKETDARIHEPNSFQQSSHPQSCRVSREQWLREATDADGVRLWDAMDASGFDPADVRSAALAEGTLKAFLELHIEQGPILEQMGKPIGIVETISGVCNWTVRLHGAANHAGSTPMPLRADAFAGLAAIAASIPELIADVGTAHSKITIGKVELQPNTPHTIPGEAEFSVIFKEADEGAMRRLTEAFAARIEQGAAANRLTFEIEEHSWLAPAPLDEGLRRVVEEEADKRSVDYFVMPSGGGHDAQTLAAICPTALVFVPSKGGISHSPAEDTAWDDIAVGAELMLAVLHRLCMA